MWDFLSDVLLFGLLEELLERGPRPVRIGCTILLFATFAALIAFVIWALMK